MFDLLITPVLSIMRTFFFCENSGKTEKQVFWLFSKLKKQYLSLCHITAFLLTKIYVVTTFILL